MPNWVKHHVIINGEENNVKKFIDECLFTKNDEDEEIAFSFNSVIPMPESLDISCGSYTETGMEILKATEEERKRMMDTIEDTEKLNEILELGRIALDNIEKYGYPTWYEWRINNWGTKWDSSESSASTYSDSAEIWFETAWNTPMPVMEELSRKYDLEVIVEYADEDLGCNCGKYTYVNGDLQEDSEEDFEFACEIWGYDPDELKEEYDIE